MNKTTKRRRVQEEINSSEYYLSINNLDINNISVSNIVLPKINEHMTIQNEPNRKYSI